MSFLVFILYISFAITLNVTAGKLIGSLRYTRQSVLTSGHSIHFLL